MLMLLGILHLYTLDLVRADYCEFGWCEDEKQYCCGKNKCCNKNLDLWFFWAGILLVIFVLALIALCRKPNDYQLLSTEVILPK